jgi:hypothetical protein
VRHFNPFHTHIQRHFYRWREHDSFITQPDSTETSCHVSYGDQRLHNICSSKTNFNIIFSYGAPNYYSFQEIFSTDTFVFPVEVYFLPHPSFSLKNLHYQLICIRNDLRTWRRIVSFSPFLDTDVRATLKMSKIFIIFIPILDPVCIVRDKQKLCPQLSFCTASSNISNQPQQTWLNAVYFELGELEITFAICQMTCHVIQLCGSLHYATSTTRGKRQDTELEDRCCYPQHLPPLHFTT